jgi:hypothetical protein
MNTAITNAGEKLLSLTTGSSIPTAGSIFKFDNLNAESDMEGSVNNYFKSMKEIEAEFLASMSAAKTTLRNMLSDISQFGHNLINLDGDTNIPIPDGRTPGYMEENY